MKINNLERVAVLGLGLLGGSLGLAINRVFPKIRRFGYSHREITREKALENGAVDAIFDTVADAVEEAQLVILASPINVFESMFKEMADALPDGAIITDVGSTKVIPVDWAREYLPERVEFLGSHPMAGSEQRGVEFARADLFDAAHCILTPVENTTEETLALLEEFWTALGMRLSKMAPDAHDQLVGNISHLPHVLAMALINMSVPDEMLLCGKGFLDTTRIASGPPSVWRDILMGNAENTRDGIGKLIEELKKVQVALDKKDDQLIVSMLTEAREKRNELVENKLKRKELPA